MMNRLLLLCFALHTAFACDGIEKEIEVTEKIQILTSPNFDDGSFYQPQLQCYWALVTNNQNAFIKINITDIDLPDHQRCNDDPLEISYDDSIPPYLSYCGKNDANKVIVIAANALPKIKFLTGMTERSLKGFRLEYSLIPDNEPCKAFQCKHDLECVYGDVQCDGKADCYDGSDEEGCGHKVVEPKICGVSQIKPKLGNEEDRIIGGKAAVPFSWPWQVSIQSNYVFPSGHLCGGALINNLWVLTAAHCVVGSFFKVFRVRFGVNDQYQTSQGEQQRFIAGFYLHPEYNRFDAFNDLALIKLSAPVDFSRTVSPVCLPKSQEELETGTKLHATGWGDDFINGPTSFLKQVEVPKMDWKRCHDLHENNREVATRTMCTGFVNGGHNPCFGDSGGPLVAETNSKWSIFGVVSWGPTVCGHELEPTVYTEVSQFIDWIKQTIETYN